jgi:hypothetical protein
MNKDRRSDSSGLIPREQVRFCKIDEQRDRCHGDHVQDQDRSGYCLFQVDAWDSMCALQGYLFINRVVS